MRLIEIISDSEPEVYDHMRKLLCMLKVAKHIPTLSTSFDAVISQYTRTLYEDESNLVKFILTSSRISALYDEIKEYV